MQKQRKVLVTGACGQLGSEIRRMTAGSDCFIFTDYLPADGILPLDICDPEAVAACIADNSVGTIINCAAWTNVEKAEDEPELCRRINCDGVAILADAALQADASLIQISTDFVFDGSKGSPYLETDAPAPLSVYGRSKAESEFIFRTSGVSGIIIRTAWLYSPYGKNFLKTMLYLGSTRPAINVVNDQAGSPTYSEDLAAVILKLLPLASEKKGEIYNYSNEGVCTWYEFSCEIMRQAGLPCKVNPVTSSEYPQKAVRPSYSYLDKSKIAAELGLDVPQWQVSLQKCLERLI
ncbi:MAG: dTDP-4-dehydrorhamnose reductase [Bacteroidales bacterium]|nr:dTDP-4-dehydrorhamnose reductase [Bacteroidales bacterium]